MNIQFIYYDFPELMTPEEKEELDFEEYDDEDSRKEFERRKPALGLSKDQIQQLRDHYNDPRLLPVQKRNFVSTLKDKMMRQLICTDGYETAEELFALLQAELDTNTPAPVPKWYVYSKVTHGPRDVGYYECENRGCCRTETVDRCFDKCARCKLAWYCSRECQKEDWSARHKKICKEAKRKNDMCADAGKVIQMYAQRYS